MKKLSLVVFDMDGLLINSEMHMWIVNEEKVVKEMGYEFSEPLFKSIMGQSAQLCLSIIKEHYGNDFDEIKYNNRLRELNDITIANNEIPLCNGVIEILEYLKSKNIPMRIATSTYKRQAEAILKNLNLRNYFESITCGDDVVHSKPNPEIYNKAIGNVNKDEVIIFEDAHSGAQAGFNSGAHVIIVPNIAMVTEEDKKQAYAVVSSLIEGIDVIKKIVE